MPQESQPVFEILAQKSLAFHTRHFEDLVFQLLYDFLECGCLHSVPESHLLPLSSAAVLHDIGKCVLSSQLIDKPNALTPFEREIIKQHTNLGAVIFDVCFPRTENTLALKYAREIALCHHERWDGGGYPAGLKGGQIPDYVQVVSLADCYDALRMQRSYRPEYSHEQAVEMILSGACGAFQPQVLSIFKSAISHIAQPLYCR